MPNFIAFAYGVTVELPAAGPAADGAWLVGSLADRNEVLGREPDEPVRHTAVDPAVGRDTVLEAARDYSNAAAAKGGRANRTARTRCD